jgi:hypothetical protein
VEKNRIKSVLDNNNNNQNCNDIENSFTEIDNKVLEEDSKLDIEEGL